jgi:Zn-dependent peptidase ImmA (M78 family)
MQRRQQWMREYVIELGQDPLSFVGSARSIGDVKGLAQRIRSTLGLTKRWAIECSTWEEALRKLRDAIEDSGILVATSGVVGLNNRRTLDPEEFRGFVLSDRYAPLVFVNGADTKSAQMFTLAHEVAHVWLGKDGIFNLIHMLPANDKTERFCNQVAAELLVPKQMLLDRWPEAEASEKPFHTIARWFKVSPIVAARRGLDLKLISKPDFFAFYNQYKQEWQQHKARAKRSGGDFYRTQNVRLGKRFGYAVVQAAKEGRLLYRDAYRLTGLKGSTFDRYAALLSERMEGGAA